MKSKAVQAFGKSLSKRVLRGFAPLDLNLDRIKRVVIYSGIAMVGLLRAIVRC